MKGLTVWCNTALLCVLLLGLIPATVYSQNARMVSRNDGTLERLYMKSISEGYIPPTTIQSISHEEARFYGLIAPEDDVDRAFWSGSILVQPFVIGWTGLDSEQWDAGYSNRLADFPLAKRLTLNDPVLQAKLSFGAGAFYATASADVQTDSQIKYADTDGVLGIWQPMEYLSWWNFPKEAYLSWSNNHMTLAAGRFPTGIGLGEANLFLNGQAFWYDHLQFSWWSEKFRFFSLWGTSSTHLSEDEYAIQSNMDPDGDGVELGWDDNDNHDYSVQNTTALKMFTYHRLEFKPFKWLGFGMGEMQMIGGKMPDFSNLLPLMIWHNTYSPGVSNVMMLVDVWSVPLPGLLLYGEFIMDDMKAPSEGDASKPNCWGWEAGATAVLPVSPPGWTFAVNIEYSHVDEWTYARWQPYLTMYQRQIMTGGWSGLDIPLGHPEGNDVTQAGIRFTALGRDERRIEFGYTWISKGPLYLGRTEEVMIDYGSGPEPVQIPVYFDYDYWAGPGELKRITGSTRKYTHALNLRGVWPILPSVKVDAEVDFLIIQNYAHRRGNTQKQSVIKAGVIWEYDRTGKKRS